MATQAVKVKNEEIAGRQRARSSAQKVTGTIADTREFLHDVRVEMKQVTWPSREDVISTTGVVIATVFFFGVFLWVVELAGAARRGVRIQSVWRVRGLQIPMAMQWYIIHTYSGFEKKVKESLESRVAAFRLQDKIGRVLIPMEDVVEVRGGKKVVSSRMSYPGYVLVEMDLDENTWHIVRIHAARDRICRFGDIAFAADRKRKWTTSSIACTRRRTGRSRRWCSSATSRCASWMGRLRISTASVEEIDNDHSRLKVSVTIFGRSTPVELDFASVEKLG